MIQTIEKDSNSKIIHIGIGSRIESESGPKCVKRTSLGLYDVIMFSAQEEQRLDHLKSEVNQLTAIEKKERAKASDRIIFVMFNFAGQCSRKRVPQVNMGKKQT